MNLVKSEEYLNPLNVGGRCHIIGCGSVGSAVAELLARLGITQISLYDFDVVSSHNLANQLFYNKDIKRNKIDVVKEMICAINPEAEEDIELFPAGYVDKTKLYGFVFLCVDNIDLRREICEKNKFNKSIKAIFDFRTGLEIAQHFAADWSNNDHISYLLSTMEFTHEEAKEITPVTACNVEMGVAPTVRIISSYGVSNFMNYVRGKPITQNVVIDAFNFTADGF